MFLQNVPHLKTWCIQEREKVNDELNINSIININFGSSTQFNVIISQMNITFLRNCDKIKFYYKNLLTLNSTMSHKMGQRLTQLFELLQQVFRVRQINLCHGSN